MSFDFLFPGIGVLSWTTCYHCKRNYIKANYFGRIIGQREREYFTRAIIRKCIESNLENILHHFNNKRLAISISCGVYLLEFNRVEEKKEERDQDEEKNAYKREKHV